MVELRVHGVSGTPPDQILDDPHPRRVDGDSASGFWRPRDPGDRRFTEEAYAWGGLTSGSPFRATWVLLAPFALVNAALAMRRRESRVAAAATRLFAASLTVTLVGSTYIVATDLLAWQCGSSAACVERNSYTHFLGWDWLEHPGRRIAISLALPVTVVAVLWLLARSTWQRAEAYVPEARVMPLVVQTPFDEPSLWDGRARGRLLRHLHVALAVASVSALAALAFVETSDRGEVQLGASSAVLALSIGLLLPGVRAHVSAARARLGQIALAGAWLASAAVFALGWSQPAMQDGVPAQLPGVERSVTYLFVGQLVLLAVLAAASRWTAAAVGLLALAVGAAFSAGVVVWGADLLGDPDTGELQLPEGIAWAARGTALVLGLVIVGAVVATLVVAVRRMFDVAPAHPLDRALRLARLTDRVPTCTAIATAVLLPLIVAGTAVVVAIDLGRADGIREQTTAPAWRGFTVAGSRLITLFAIGLVLLARASFRSATMRRRVGIVWDVATFWPRHAHPLAPPCYAERAVPELGQRIAFLRSGDPRRDVPGFRPSRVVVSAHSQGSVIAAAALLRQGQAVDGVALVTYGSPLDRLYHRYFPMYFGGSTTSVLRDRLDRRWVNLYRRTDPIGGPIADAGCDWEVPVHEPAGGGAVEGHSNYTREAHYRDALTQAEWWLSGRLYA